MLILNSLAYCYSCYRLAEPDELPRWFKWAWLVCAVWNALAVAGACIP